MLCTYIPYRFKNLMYYVIYLYLLTVWTHKEYSYVGRIATHSTEMDLYKLTQPVLYLYTKTRAGKKKKKT